MSDIQKDLVLSINEYAYVLDETKGHVSCLVGPTKMSLSQSDKLVRFNHQTKAFEPCDFYISKHLFTTVPENWYCILKNPVEGNRHPSPGSSNSLPENVQVGRKINVRGPANFALYPGQMAKVIRGHSLRTNQYLLARVYEAEAANNSQGEMRDANGNLIETKETYVNGQNLIIKGTEVSFYIPPTGIEVVPLNSKEDNNYTREAVTLERLEYCILKDEDGNKVYKHGPAVVFPKPTESFVTSPKGGYVFRAIELSAITGIYIKVIAEYEDENGTVHPVGEEQFITGNDQMIYYPRPEHAIINYDNKITHHAIAIPKGEGRYVMNRLTGEITTITGPAMYLPDPRTEIVVKRKLTPSQCNLWYPGNKAVAQYNESLTERKVEKELAATAKSAYNAAKAVNTSYTTASTGGVFGMCDSAINSLTSAVDALESSTIYATDSLNTTLANLEANANISRGTSYTKPRTITLDNRFDGVVSINVWNGYAVNVVSNSGARRTVCGPQTILLDYDETLESVISNGTPTVYLSHTNNKFKYTFDIETKDHVCGTVSVTFFVNFMENDKDKWFNIKEYSNLILYRFSSLIKNETRNYFAEEFYHDYNHIISDVISINNTFDENGMIITHCEISELNIDEEILDIILKHRTELIEQSIKLADANSRVALAEELSIAEDKEQDLKTKQMINRMELQRQEGLRKLEIQSEFNRRQDAEKYATKQAELDLDALKDVIHEANLARKRKEEDQQYEHQRRMDELESLKRQAYADMVAHIVESISPDLVAAMNTKSNADMTVAISEALAPYAIANGESVADVVNKLLRGTALESVISGINLNTNN